MYTSLNEDISRFHVGIYLAGSSVLSAFVVINLYLDQWFKYCYWDVGLVVASSWNDNFDGESTIKDAHSDACKQGDFKIKDHLQDCCPDLCDNLDNSQLAGGFMIAFGCLTVISLIFVFLLHVLLLCRKKINMRFSWLLMLLPTLFWLLGFVAYTAIIRTNDIRGTSNPSHYTQVNITGDSNPKEFEMKGGMIFAIINIIFFFSHMVHGLIFTRRYL